ncbi:MAG: nuclear transport factor 2 family protein [Polyangiaceae bacterium]|nr:nuclear transport factor 2 family protein [Polyangiaceae bacterium]
MTISAEERLDIHELLARLDHAVDAQDWSAYLAHFERDARMDPGFAPPVEGVEAIRAFLMASEGGTRGKRHLASNVFLEERGEEVVAHSYLTVVEREDIPRVVATARITDTLVRRGGAFRVRVHQVQVDPGMFKAFAASQAASQT